MGTQARRSLRKARKSQAGVAASVLLTLAGLLIVMLVLGLAGSLSRQQEADRRTGEALAQAKAALLGYAVSYPERQGTGTDQFGYLPCPDSVVSVIPEGNEESACGARDVTWIGRLPWKSLGLPALRDSANECLWYAVSGNFKAGTKSLLLNWDSNALIEVLAPGGATHLAGSAPTNRAAAVIFGPGAVLPGQNRTTISGTPTCGGNYTASNYLDTDTASGIDNAASSGTANALTSMIAALSTNHGADPSQNFNDRLVYITSEDIWREAAKRSDFMQRLTDPNTGVLGFAANCLVERAVNTGINQFDWTAPIALANYHPQANYAPQSGMLVGRLPNVLGSCAGWASVESYWRNWKDHFFYAVAEPFRPGSPNSTNPSPCTTGGKCLTVDGDGPYAAVVVFAGERNAGQNRNTNSDYSSPDKGNPSNYLEGQNLDAFQAGSVSDADWGVFSRSAGNDIVITICADPPAFSVNQPCAPQPSQCQVDGLALLAYRDVDDSWRNNCLNPLWWQGLVKPECRTIRDRIAANCTEACGDAARDFVRWPCLYNLNDSRCDPIIDALENCS